MTYYPLIKDGQRYALNKLIGRFTDTRDARLFVLSKLLHKDVKTPTNLTIQDWRTIRDKAYPHWVDDDWQTISDQFRNEVAHYAQQFQEEVLGQMRLF